MLNCNYVSNFFTFFYPENIFEIDFCIRIIRYEIHTFRISEELLELILAGKWTINRLNNEKPNNYEKLFSLE